MRKFTISFTRSDTGITSTAEGEFEDEEVDKLCQFLTYAKELTELSILKSGQFGKMNIHHQVGKRPTFDVSLPSAEATAALLHKLRRFILHREPTSYNNITALLKRRLRVPMIHLIIDQERKLYDGRTGQSQILINVNGTALNSEETLHKWLNSVGEYHDDAQGRKELEQLNELMPDEATKFIMLMVLSDKVRAIINVANFVGLLLGEVQVFEARLSQP